VSNVNERKSVLPHLPQRLKSGSTPWKRRRWSRKKAERWPLVDGFGQGVDRRGGEREVPRLGIAVPGGPVGKLEQIIEVQYACQVRTKVQPVSDHPEFVYDLKFLLSCWNTSGREGFRVLRRRGSAFCFS
jgi:hypothetical protein